MVGSNGKENGGGSEGSVIGCSRREEEDRIGESGKEDSGRLEDKGRKNGGGLEGSECKEVAKEGVGIRGSWMRKVGG